MGLDLHFVIRTIRITCAALAMLIGLGPLRAAENVQSGATAQDHEATIAETIRWLARWRSFSATYSHDSIAEGKGIAGGQKRVFRRGKYVLLNDQWRSILEEISRIDRATDQAHRSFLEGVGAKVGALSVQKNYRLLKLTNDDLATGDPFRFFDAEQFDDRQSPQLNVYYNSKSETKHTFIPLILELGQSDREPGGAIREFLSQAQLQITPASDAQGQECIQIVGDHRHARWKLLIASHPPGAIVAVERKCNEHFVNLDGKSNREYKSRNSFSSMTMTEAASDWSHITFDHSTHTEFLDGESRKSSGRFRLTDLQFDIDESNLAIETPIPNGTAVTLSHEPQIKAEWRDGKVVRVYNKEAVETLADLTFAKPRRSWTRWWPAGVAIFAGGAALLVRWLQRKRGRVRK